MKKVILFLSAGGLCALLAIGIISGEKENPRNEQDLQGIQVVKGDDGNIIYSGTGAPPANLGNIGDFYIQTADSKLYGPKTTVGWGIPVGLSGAARATETVETRFLSGATEAVTNIGAVGDYYPITTR